MKKTKYFFFFVIGLSLIISGSLISAETFGYGKTEDIPLNFSNIIINETSNQSEYWNTNLGSLNNVNSTEFENSGGTLTHKKSWLTSFITGIVNNILSTFNRFDQELNTTSNVKFINVNATGNITAAKIFTKNETLQSYSPVPVVGYHQIFPNNGSKTYQYIRVEIDESTSDDSFIMSLGDCTNEWGGGCMHLAYDGFSYSDWGGQPEFSIGDGQMIFNHVLTNYEGSFLVEEDGSVTGSQFCNSTGICKDLSQWGSVDLSAYDNRTVTATKYYNTTQLNNGTWIKSETNAKLANLNVTQNVTATKYCNGTNVCKDLSQWGGSSSVQNYIPLTSGGQARFDAVNYTITPDDYANEYISVSYTPSGDILKVWGTYYGGLGGDGYADVITSFSQEPRWLNESGTVYLYQYHDAYTDVEWTAYDKFVFTVMYR